MFNCEIPESVIEEPDKRLFDHSTNWLQEQVFVCLSNKVATGTIMTLWK